MENGEIGTAQSNTWSRRKAIGVGGAVAGGAWLAPQLITTPAAAAQSVAAFWAAVGDQQQSPTAWYSSDGDTWASAATPPTDMAYGVAADGEGLWVAVGSSSFTSPDGINWTESSTPISSFCNGVAVDFAGGTWVAVGANATYRSIDNGDTWSSAATPISGLASDIAYDGAARWVAVGSPGLGGGFWYSDDVGDTWSAATTTPPDVIMGVASDGAGHWVAVGFGFWTSTDGDTWTLVDATKTASSVATHAAGNWVAVGSSESWWSDDNGATWNASTTPVDGGASDVATDGSGLWVTVGFLDAWTSVDNGDNWVQASTPITGGGNSVASARLLP